MATFINTTLDAVAFTLCPLSIIAPLGGLTIVSSVLFARAGCSGRREEVTPQQWTCILMITIGVATVDVYGPKPEPVLDATYVLNRYRQPSWLVYQGVALGVVGATYAALCTGMLGGTGLRTTVLTALSGGLMAGITQNMMKLLSTVAAACALGGELPFHNSLFWLASAEILVVAGALLHMLNLCIASATMAVASSLYQVCVITCTIVASSAYFGDFDAVVLSDQSLFSIGVVFVLLGLGALVQIRTLQDAHAQLLADDALCERFPKTPPIAAVPGVPPGVPRGTSECHVATTDRPPTPTASAPPTQRLSMAVHGRNCTSLASANPIPLLDSRIDFSEEGHRYFIDGEVFVGKSATTLVKDSFSGEEFNGPLIVRKNLASWRSKPSSRYHKLVSHLNDASAEAAILKQWDDANVLGTQTHLVCERVLNGDPPGDEALTVSKELSQFKSFLEDNPTLQPYRTELSLFYTRPDGSVSVCGQLDALLKCSETGQVVMIDFKRTTHDLAPDKHSFGKEGLGCLEGVPANDFHKYSLQLSIYSVLCEHHGLHVDSLFILKLHNDIESYELVQCCDLVQEARAILSSA